MSDNANQFGPIKQLKKKKSHKKLIVAVAILISLIIGVVIWLYLSGFISNWLHPKIQTKSPVSSVSTDAINSIISGDYAGGQAILDKNLSDTTDPKSQAWIYIQKSSIALNLTKYDNAYAFAKKAEELYPTETSAQMMAAAAEKQGNIQEAIIDYKLAAGRITGLSGMNAVDKKDLQDKIIKLGGRL